MLQLIHVVPSAVLVLPGVGGIVADDAGVVALTWQTPFVPQK